jgi:hypothetical protein
MLVSLDTHSSTVESDLSARKTTQSPIVAVSIAGRMPNEVGVRDVSGGGGGGGVCTFGALESLQAKALAAADVAATSSAARVWRFMV